MAASGHFEFCALPRVAQTFKRGVAAYFVTNTLKYQKKASNFVTRGLVTEFMILPLLILDIRSYKTMPKKIHVPMNQIVPNFFF